MFALNLKPTRANVGWVDSATAVTSLRSLLFDGAADKMASNKKVFGVQDGTNITFKTFEYRRVTDFTTATFPLGVFKDGIAIATNKVTVDDTATGTFKLDITVTPSTRVALTASYYYQWFTDTDLITFLTNASTWLGLGPLYYNLPDGLNAAALRYAAQEAYEMAAMKYSTRAAEVFQLEDAPSEDILKSIAAFQSMADNFMDKASKMRDDYYTRQGQSLAPNFGFQLGKVWDPTPRR